MQEYEPKSKWFPVLGGDLTSMKQQDNPPNFPNVELEPCPYYDSSQVGHAWLIPESSRDRCSHLILPALVYSRGIHWTSKVSRPPISPHGLRHGLCTHHYGWPVVAVVTLRWC